MKSFLVIGIGEYGHAMAVQLSRLGNEVLAADCDETRLSDLLGVVASAKIGDCTRPEVLRSFGAEDFDACIVCIRENFQNSLEITAQLSELGAKQVISLAGSAARRTSASNATLPGSSGTPQGSAARAAVSARASTSSAARSR